jgi:hypothetical protein
MRMLESCALARKHVVADRLPYVNAYGVISKTLEKIKSAATPPRFTLDFLATKLALKGGSARPVIPFLKRVGFLGTDGSPSELYKQFRNPTHSGSAAAKALKIGYSALYEMNEYAHDLPEKELKGLIVQATGGEPESSTTRAIVGSFKALKAAASFSADDTDEEEDSESTEDPEENGDAEGKTSRSRDEGVEKLKLGLSYTINLNLPATSDVAVFNAIFKSLREHILR